MDPLVVGHMLPQVIDPHIHQFHRVQGTAAVLGGGRRMGGPAPEGEGGLDVGLVGAHHHFVLGPRVPGKGRIHISKDPFPGHVGLAAAPFFRRTAIDPDGALARMGCQIVLQQEPGAHSGSAQ